MSPLPPTSLARRDVTTSFHRGDGSINPATLNNQIFIGLFASLGGLMVLASLWFFFWAKNGGFHWQENDWDDYKSTVLRRKGPDGKTLSNATKSTKLGGSTIAGTQRFPWEARMKAKSVVSYDEKGRKGVLGKRGFGKTHSVFYSDDFTDSKSRGTETVSDMTEDIRGDTVYEQEPSHHSKRYRDRDVREYKKERPARVGGLNRVADGSGVNIGASTLAGSDINSQAGSDLPILPHQHKSPKPQTPKQNDRAAARAREEAGKMERRWKKEAEEAAASLARESVPAPKKAVAPSSSKPPSPPKHRQASRSNSPKKREFSYGGNDAATEVLSTAYTSTASSGQRTASYYDSYRPRAESNPRHSMGDAAAAAKKTRQSSPKKKAQGGRSGGYRRGADSDLE